MTKRHLLVGCDPEFFVFRNSEGIVSAHGMVPGTKAQPHAAGTGAIQVDGLALEFNTKPAKTEEEFDKNVSEMLERLEAMLPKDHRLDRTTTTHTFSREYLSHLPDEAKELGCEADFSAYTGLENPAPDEHTAIRTTSGHVHLGWDSERNVADPSHFNSCMIIAQELDIMLGVPSVILDPEGAKRRVLYGMAGAFRPKPYGVEYRVLSNFWVDNANYRKWVFKQSSRAYNGLMGNLPDQEPGQNRIRPNTAETCIRANDAKLAQRIVEELGIEMP